MANQCDHIICGLTFKDIYSKQLLLLLPLIPSSFVEIPNTSEPSSVKRSQSDVNRENDLHFCWLEGIKQYGFQCLYQFAENCAICNIVCWGVDVSGWQLYMIFICVEHALNMVRVFSCNHPTINLIKLKWAVVFLMRL